MHFHLETLHHLHTATEQDSCAGVPVNQAHKNHCSTLHLRSSAPHLQAALGRCFRRSAPCINPCAMKDHRTTQHNCCWRSSPREANFIHRRSFPPTQMKTQAQTQSAELCKQPERANCQHTLSRNRTATFVWAYRFFNMYFGRFALKYRVTATLRRIKDRCVAALGTCDLSEEPAGYSRQDIARLHLPQSGFSLSWPCHKSFH